MQLQWVIAAIVPVLAIAANNKEIGNLAGESRAKAVQRGQEAANKVRGVASTGRRPARYAREIASGETSEDISEDAPEERIWSDSADSSDGSDDPNDPDGPDCSVSPNGMVYCFEFGIFNDK